MSATYLINEAYFSLQGEGKHAGVPSIFLRFAKCNMECAVEAGPKSPGGFDCDTEFESGRRLDLEEIEDYVGEIGGRCKRIIVTGGEPALQVDGEFLRYFHELDYEIAIETNGSIDIHARCGDESYDWITVSPKVAEHAIKQRRADEVKYVRAYGQVLPDTVVDAEHKLVSPAFDGTDLDAKTLKWCIQLVKDNPEWALSCQLHKMWAIL